MKSVYIGGNTIRTDKEMKLRDPNDFYETEKACIRAYFDTHPLPAFNAILDAGAGNGVWGDVLKQRYDIDYLIGVEVQEHMFNPRYNTWISKDYLHYPTYVELKKSLQERGFAGVDAVIGNPPYKFAEEFFHRSMQFLKPTGSLIYLLRLGFLASESRFGSMWTAGFAPTLVTVLNTRPSFSGDGKTYPGDFAVFRWDFIEGVCKSDMLFDFLTYKRD